MIGYKDRKFCNSDCTNSGCFRYLENWQVDDAAEKGQLIAFGDFRKECAAYRPGRKKRIFGGVKDK